MCTGAQGQFYFCKKEFILKCRVGHWLTGSEECHGKVSSIAFFHISKIPGELQQLLHTSNYFFKQKEILLVSNKTQACEFTLLRVYLALLSIAPAFLDSSDMVQSADRDFS